MIKELNKEEKDSVIKKRGQRVLFIRKNLLELSRADFCKNFKLTPQSLKIWELGWGGGLREARAEDLVNHIRTLGISTTVAWIMHGIGPLPTPLSQDTDIVLEEDEHIAKELLVFRELENTVDIIIDDDNMAPLLQTGDYVGGVLISDPKLALDQICIITDSRDKVLVRVLKQGDKENFYNLECINKNGAFITEIKNMPIKKAAPVLWIRKRKRHKPTHQKPW